MTAINEGLMFVCWWQSGSCNAWLLFDFISVEMKCHIVLDSDNVKAIYLVFPPNHTGSMIYLLHQAFKAKDTMYRTKVEMISRSTLD